MAGFAPGKALERGAGGSIGIGTADFAPDAAYKRAPGIEIASFEPEKALRSGWRGPIGIGTAVFAPAAASGRAPGIRMAVFAPAADLSRAAIGCGPVAGLPLEG